MRDISYETYTASRFPTKQKKNMCDGNKGIYA